jgi:hypothetical protein
MERMIEATSNTQFCSTINENLVTEYGMGKCIPLQRTVYELATNHGPNCPYVGLSLALKQGLRGLTLYTGPVDTYTVVVLIPKGFGSTAIKLLTKEPSWGVHASTVIQKSERLLKYCFSLPASLCNTLRDLSKKGFVFLTPSWAGGKRGQEGITSVSLGEREENQKLLENTFELLDMPLELGMRNHTLIIGNKQIVTMNEILFSISLYNKTRNEDDFIRLSTLKSLLEMQGISLIEILQGREHELIARAKSKGIKLERWELKYFKEKAGAATLYQQWLDFRSRW